MSSNSGPSRQDSGRDSPAGSNGSRDERRKVPMQRASSSANSWQRMLIERSLEKVKSGQCSLEDVAIERFGSIQAFEDSCKEFGIVISPDRKAKSAKAQESSKRSEPEPELPVEDINLLAAKRLKAEMKGDIALVKELDAKMERAQKASKAPPIQLLPPEAHQGKEVGDASSISQMYEHEKLASSHELDEELARKISKTSRYSSRPQDQEEFSDRFGAPGYVKKPQASAETIRRNIALGRYKRMERIQENCWFCLDSSRSDKHLVVAYGQYTYLTLPKYGQLENLHCQIIPNEHVSSMLQASDLEAVWAEIRNFKKCLLQMGASQGRRAIFLEASMAFSECRHCFIDCIVLPKDLAVDPAGYFKKAIMECDAEWAQHKRLFDTSDPSSGGLRRTIHKNFPYLYVDFRLDQGYAHVVEDEERIAPDYLRELTAGLIGMGRGEYKNRRMTDEIKQNFVEAYDPFDWTKLLHETAPQ